MCTRISHWAAFLIAALCLLPQALCAQEFVTLPREELRIDSVLPLFTHRIPLERDFASYDYAVRIEYPEFEAVTPDEAARLRQMDLDELPALPQVESSVTVSAKEGTLQVQLVPIVWREGSYKRLTSVKFAVDKTLVRRAATRAETRAETATRYAASSVLASGKWVKIRISETGIHRITHKELSAMGFSRPDRVRLYGQGGQALAETKIQDCVDDLKEVPLYRRSSDLLFYAHGTMTWTRNAGEFLHTPNTYSRYGYYFLTEDDTTTPMAFPQTEGTDEGTETTTFPDYALYENDSYSWRERGRIFFENYDYKNGRTKSYTLSLPDVVEDGTAKVRVAFGSDDTKASKVAIEVNGETCGTMNVSGISGYTLFQVGSYAYSVTGKLAESTTVKLTHTSPNSASGRLDYLQMNYTRQLKLRNGSVRFRSSAAGKRLFAVAGADANTRVWKISDGGAQGYSFCEISGRLENNFFRMGDETLLSDEYVALDISSNSFPSVEVVGEVPNQDLHALGATDMVIAVPASAKWLSQAERLANLHRTYDSLRVEVVNAEHIYNEFSSGTPDATAIRRFLKMFYDRAETSDDLPRHLLLFGDCASDNRMISTSWKKQTPDDFLLCFQSENSASETTSYVMEEYFCLLDDSEGTEWRTGKADAAVGRLTVRTLAEATTVVDKIEAYLRNAEAGAWRNKITLMADDGKSSSDYLEHMKHCDGVAEAIADGAPGYRFEKLYWDTFVAENTATGARYPEATARLKESLAEGTLMVNYFGHGAAGSLSHEMTWTLTDMENATGTRLPLWITSACDTSPIDLPEDNLGEATLLNAKGGGIAMLGTARSTYGSESYRLNAAFCKHLLIDKMTIGEALRLAKNETSVSNYNNLHYVLVGDPALRLASPDNYRVEVTELNGKPVGSSTTQYLKAGALVQLKGHVVDAEGTPVNDFHGKVYPTVYDNREYLATLGNRPDFIDEDVYYYWDYTKKLYAGSDSVRGGEFTFTFPMPLDISYSDESGNIYLYAVSQESREALGSFTDFLVGGTDESLSTDTIGPQITLRLNGEEPTGTPRVNTTPLLSLALYDADGINATGNGVGHDLIAIVDNDPTMTYVLNTYYVAETGDYTRGTVTYSLPELSEGTHTLLVRAWDVLNNSATTEVPFEVVKGLKPSLTDVWCTESPARTSTTFVVTHDRPQSELTVKIEVFDFAGRILWEHTESGTPTGNDYRVTWDLTTNSGQPVGTGIYLYRATISSGGGSESTKARKIAVGRQ